MRHLALPTSLKCARRNSADVEHVEEPVPKVPLPTYGSPCLRFSFIRCVARLSRICLINTDILNSLTFNANRSKHDLIR